MLFPNQQKMLTQENILLKQVKILIFYKWVCCTETYLWR